MKSFILISNINWKRFFGIFALLLTLDAIYISLFSNFFNRVFKKVQGGRELSIKYGGFLFTYLLMTSIIYYFGFVKRFSSSDMFLLGISIYGVYELTNYTTLIDWNLKMVFLDTLWGGILFTSTLYLLKLISTVW
jgi:uncharacterized membrane protein